MMKLTQNDEKTVALIMQNIESKEKLNDEERLFLRFYGEFQQLGGGISNDAKRFIRAFIKDFRFQQKREKERLQQQFVLSKHQKAEKKVQANRRYFNGMCVLKAQDTYDSPYFFELLFALLGVMSEKDQKKLNIRKLRHGLIIEDEDGVTINDIYYPNRSYSLTFIQGSEESFSSVSWGEDFDGLVYDIFDKGVGDLRFISKNSVLGKMIEESVVRYNRKKTIQENIEKTKQNLNLELP